VSKQTPTIRRDELHAVRVSTQTDRRKAHDLLGSGLAIVEADSQLLMERTHARFTYDNGTLEITESLEEHERYARLIERFILILVVELGMKLKTMGSGSAEFW
jgi:hypothetical protein